MPDQYEPYYIRVNWGIRKEDVRFCADRAGAMFTHLAECDPIFQRWFTLGRSRKGVLKHEIQKDPETLQGLLHKGRNRTDFGQQVIPELGYSFCAWNGGKDDEDAVGIDFHCGLYTPLIANNCQIRLPPGEDSQPRVMQIPVLIDVLKTMVTSWEPDWGMVNTRKYTMMPPRKNSKSPIVSWITYLAQDRGIIPPLPLPTRVLEIEGYGHLIILTEERFTTSNPAHLEIAQRVVAILNQAGLLEPVP